MNKKGFTLIELLIVIAVIGILASVVLVGLGPVQKQGRDSRRISDLRQVQNGLEIYYNKCGYYPGTAQPTSPCGAYTQITTWAALTTALTGSNIGISNVPVDPTNRTPYVYSYASDSTGSTYVLAAQLEDLNNPRLNDDVDGTVLGINCNDPVYCIRL
jgi:prepilin-type N-terminal cleavage/methylation domain-containing protein